MNAIKFNCPKCGQHIEAPTEMEGQTVGCPVCNHRIAIRSSSLPETEAEKKTKAVRHHAAKLHENAAHLVFLGWALIILAVVFLVGSFCFAASTNAKPELFVRFGGIVRNMVVLGLFLALLGQVTHIRAHLLENSR